MSPRSRACGETNQRVREREQVDGGVIPVSRGVDTARCKRVECVRRNAVLPLDFVD
jgi:hypothetical protein